MPGSQVPPSDSGTNGKLVYGDPGSRGLVNMLLEGSACHFEGTP